MLAQFLVIVHLLASDVHLPFGINESLIAATEDFAADPTPLAPSSTRLAQVPDPEPLPLARAEARTLAVQAERAVLLDATSATVLLAKNADEPASPASIAKLMTALVALDQVDSLDDALEVPTAISKLDPASSVAGLVPGEHLRVGDLLTALLVASANDAAVTLAHGLLGSERAFVTKMNDKAKLLGLTKTSFDNVSGLDSPGNRSTARDLAFLLMQAQRQPLVRQLTTLGPTSITSLEANTYYLQPTDQLLAVTNHTIRAAKTGTTKLAGQSFVVMAEQDGHRLIAVLLDSPDRFTEAEAMLSYGFEAFAWDGQAEVQPYGG